LKVKFNAEGACRARSARRARRGIESPDARPRFKKKNKKREKKIKMKKKKKKVRTR